MAAPFLADYTQNVGNVIAHNREINSSKHSILATCPIQRLKIVVMAINVLITRSYCTTFVVSYFNYVYTNSMLFMILPNHRRLKSIHGK